MNKSAGFPQSTRQLARASRFHCGRGSKFGSGDLLESCPCLTWISPRRGAPHGWIPAIIIEVSFLRLVCLDIDGTGLDWCYSIYRGHLFFCQRSPMKMMGLAWFNVKMQEGISPEQEQQGPGLHTRRNMGSAVPQHAFEALPDMLRCIPDKWSRVLCHHCHTPRHGLADEGGPKRLCYVSPCGHDSLFR